MWYLALLILGGTLLVASLVFDHDNDAAAEPSGGTGAASAMGLSLRGLISGVTFFGLAGVIGSALSLPAASVALVAVASGGLTFALTATVMNAVRKRQVSTERASMIGRTGVVLVPPTTQHPGKIALNVTGGTRQYLARGPAELRERDTVIVIGEERGLLEVRHWDGLA